MSLVNDALKRAKESHDQQAATPAAITPAPRTNLGPAPRSSRVWIFALLAFLAAIGLAIGGVAHLKKQNQIAGATTASEPNFFTKLKEKFSHHNSDTSTATAPSGEPTGPHIVIITKNSTNISEPTKSGKFESVAPPPAEVSTEKKAEPLVVDNRRPIKLLPQVAPTAAETAAAVVQPPQPIKLQGILYSATRPAAIVNGRTVFVGDRIGEMTVASISQKQIVMLYETNHIVVKLP